MIFQSSPQEWNGSGWAVTHDFTSSSVPLALAGSGSNDLFMGGAGIWHFEAGGWTKLATPAGFPAYIGALAVTKPGEVWAAPSTALGAGREYLWHYKAGVWRQLWSGSKANTTLKLTAVPGVDKVRVVSASDSLGYSGDVSLTSDP